MKLLNYRVQYETQEKIPGEDVGWLVIGEFKAYNEQHLWVVMKDKLGYYPPIYHIIEVK